MANNTKWMYDVVCIYIFMGTLYVSDNQSQQQ